MRFFYAVIALATLTLPISAARKPIVGPTQEQAIDPRDSTARAVDADAVVVRSSAKETNKAWSVPGAVSLITPRTVSGRNVESVKDLSTLVPNLFIPDYGSKMTTPVYLRGVGARSSGQSVGMYVDNIPYMDKSTFDFEFMDIQRIEVLRGPQGTLYGRNAMGGILNIYTLSPFEYQGHKISIGGGSHGTYSAKASKYVKLSDRVAMSVAGYWEREGGYFTNEFTGQKVDEGQSTGGRIKLEWRITDRLRAILSTSYDYTDQGAFAYGMYHKESGVIDPVNYNDRGSYLRNMSNNSLRLEYKTDKILFSSNTGYQWLSDDMWMDQDFTSQEIFTINQRQKQHSVNQEFSVRSITDRNYQWSFGAFAFYNDLTTDGDVSFKKDGIATILQPVFDNMMPPSVPIKIKITDTEIPNPGTYGTPSTGVALFHQSTYNNLFTEGLSMTLGVRVDYEKQFMSYNTNMTMNTAISMPGPPRPPMQYTISDTLTGSTSQQLWQFLPKLAIKYECTPNIMTYATISKGYKTGGYNIQMFSEVIQDKLKNNRPAMPGAPAPPAAEPTDNINESTSYRPEITWNYEVGARANLFDGVLTGELALFYMDIKDVQLTQFVEGGSGRILANAGRGRSYGAELSLTARPVSTLVLDMSYGYNHATFTDYNAGADKTGNVLDYSGKFIPYTPQHTFSIGASYAWNFNCWLDQLTLAAQYNGAGKIYWTEANDISQKFYGLLNAKVSMRHKFVRLELWTRNALNTSYGAFYFESFGNSFIQKGKPFSCGANLVFSF